MNSTVDVNSIPFNTLVKQIDINIIQIISKLPIFVTLTYAINGIILLGLIYLIIIYFIIFSNKYN